MPESITLQAPAKLNLALAVGPPPEPSAIHPICSWMVTINLHDEIALKRLPDDRLSRYAILWHEDARRRSDINWSITKDLAVRAHLALEKHVGRKLPVQLKLEKRIPVGGGLGGGSSDAAAMLHAVNELFDLNLNLSELVSIAQTLGSDVPFLVHGGSAIVEGAGERIETHDDVPELHAVVVLPGEQCPTRDVYQAFDECATGNLQADAVRDLARSLPRAPSSESLFNDLTAPALRIAPSLESHLQRIASIAERPAHLSGSGSTLFVLCDDALHADHLARALENAMNLPALPVQPTPARAIAPQRATISGPLRSNGARAQ